MNLFSKKKKPDIICLGWSGPKNIHCTFKIGQDDFLGKGYLEVWLEYNNLGMDVIKEHTEGVISGLELVEVVNNDADTSGTSFIYAVNPFSKEKIKGVEFNDKESVIGIQDFDFKCGIKVYFRPRIDTRKDAVLLFEGEI